VIVVAAAVVERDGRYLVTERGAGAHLAGLWEFPGGKCERGESIAACLAREIREELDVEIQVLEELLRTTHEYSDRRIELHFVRCRLLGEPKPQLGQRMRWTPWEQLAELDFPPADAELIRRLTARRP
jgi:mutator protein MutT